MRTDWSESNAGIAGMGERAPVRKEQVGGFAHDLCRPRSAGYQTVNVPIQNIDFLRQLVAHPLGAARNIIAVVSPRLSPLPDVIQMRKLLLDCTRGHINGP